MVDPGPHGESAASAARVPIPPVAAAVAGVPIEVSLYALSDAAAPSELIISSTEPTISHGEMWLVDGSPADLPGAAMRLDDVSVQRGGRCVVNSTAGTTSAARCELQLPRVGRFAAAACTLDAKGAPQLCSAMLLGRT